MAKTYTEELTEWARCNGLPLRNIHRVTFLAVQEDVRSALSAGHSMRTIWRNLRELGRIGFSYNTFRIYVDRHISKPSVQAPSPAALQGSLALAKANAINSTTVTRSGPPGFSFNPIPNKEELI